MPVAARRLRDSRPGFGRVALVQCLVGQVALQAGFYGFIASMPLVLARSGVRDSTIGLIVGTAALVQTPAALVGGALVDRFGSTRLLAAGTLAYLFGAAVLVPPVDPGTSLVPSIVARVAQGVGFGLIAPAFLAALVRVAAPNQRGVALGLGASAQTLSMTAVPPVSLAVLGAGTNLTGVAAGVAFLVLGGSALIIARIIARPGRAHPSPSDPDRPRAVRRLGLAIRREWLRPLAIILLYLIHWGVITAYLPQRAEFAGADVGLFFVADGLSVLVLRVPSGWLADRLQSRWLVLSGLLMTAVALGLLALPATTPLLLVAGILTGAGAGLVTTPLHLDLSRLSTDGERGSAFALAAAALAAALAIGSVGASPVVGLVGFEGAVAITLAALGAAAILAVNARSG